MAGFLPVFGRLADMFGGSFLHRRLSPVRGRLDLVGFAPNLPALIAFRVLQAIGAALLSSNSVAIVVTAAGPEQRGRALGIMAAAQAICLSAGPALGGLMLDTLGWQWVFWINVPFGVWGCDRLVRDSAERACGRRALRLGGRVPDPAGAYRPDRGGERGACWGVTSPAFVGGVLTGIILLLLFARTEHRVATPLMDLALFRSAAFAAGNAANLIAYAMLFGLFFLMPFILIRVYEDRALTAGLRLSIVPVLLG